MSNDYSYADKDGDLLQVRTAEAQDGAPAYVATPRSGAYVARQDAPAVALAILKAAGIEPSQAAAVDSPAFAANVLARAVAALQKDAEEAKLDAEALELWKAGIPSRAFDDRVPLGWREGYREIARAARKLHGKES